MECDEVFGQRVRDVTIQLHLLVNEQLFTAEAWPPEPVAIDAIPDSLVASMVMRFCHQINGYMFLNEP